VHPKALLRALIALPLAVAAATSPLRAQAGTPDPHLDPERAQRGYVGAAACGECHAKELALWTGSYHDLAMKEATPQTVLGNFDNAEIEAHGIRSRFFRRDGGFYVRTDGPDGEPQDFPVRYTFGWYPLQQYLIEFPGGRLQSLGIAWDSRPEGQGGQRWFHLYPNEPMDHKNPLHWTAPDQTWNYQCADCHSTDLQKRYDGERDAYDTRYAEIDVACETCHGPGARHVAWARAQATAQAQRGEVVGRATTGAAADAASRGLLVDLKDRDGGVWQIDPETGKPRRSLPRALQGSAQIQIQTCAPCHSRRGRIWPELKPGEPLHQGFRLALLEPSLYFPDGQIKDEVYVYGSFIQSRMYHQGVVCSDCHDPHSLKLHAEGNAVCARCHVAARYDATEHHHHQPGSAGAACVACHMPQRYYMVVDERADHSMRVPRPDLTLKIGTPNACNGCHKDKDAAWASAAVESWYPDPVNRGPHFGEALHAADAHAPDAGSRLLALAGDPSQPAIARASALARLHDDPRRLSGSEVLVTVRRLLADPDASVRAQAVRVLELADLQTRVELVWPLLSDPIRVVRLEAARVLAPVMGQGMGDALREQMGAALEEAVGAEVVNADRPEAHLNLGLLAAAAGEPRVAEEAYRAALRLDRRFTPARANLADLYREQGRESEAEAELEAGLALDPESADLHFALGLARVRAQRLEAAIESLARAAELSPEHDRYAYVYAVALDSAGRTTEALPILETAQGRDPANRDILVALVQFNAKLGQRDAARRWLERLAALAPEDPTLEQLRALLDKGSTAAPSEEPG
jgi:tetratricopeptide (TPR) repeat protein